MRDDAIDESVLDAVIERVDAKAHQLRECLGALQVAHAPEGERLAVNRGSACCRGSRFACDQDAPW